MLVVALTALLLLPPASAPRGVAPDVVDQVPPQPDPGRAAAIPAPAPAPGVGPGWTSLEGTFGALVEDGDLPASRGNRRPGP